MTIAKDVFVFAEDALKIGKGDIFSIIKAAKDARILANEVLDKEVCADPQFAKFELSY